MRYSYRGEPNLAIGVPLPDSDAAYFEIISLTELSDTLRSLGIILAGAALVTDRGRRRPRLLGQPPGADTAVRCQRGGALDRHRSARHPARGG